MTVDLFSTGVLCRCPGGGPGENVAAQKAAGMKWAALNLGTDPCVKNDPTVWNLRRQQYASVGIPVGPWLHVRNMQDLEFLVKTGFSWQAPFIGCNIEDVVSDNLSLAAVGEYLIKVWKQPVHMPTLPWVQNGQGWQHVAFAYIALEMFPEEGGQKYLDAWQACIKHAFDEGCQKVTLLFSTMSPRSVYPNVVHCIYTADNVNTWPEWHDTVPQPIPKPPPSNGGTVPLTPNEKKEFRNFLRSYALVAQKNERKWHYTQARPYTGLTSPASDTHYNDCSSYTALAFFRAGRNAGVRVDDPLGYHYNGWGNTGSCYTYMKKYPAPEDKYRIGDVALFLESGGFGDHMMFCIKAGDGATSVWSSFGTESGPDERSLHYRNDLTGVYRPEDLR